MKLLAQQITTELQILVGQPIFDCWRAANMQIFEFGQAEKIPNRKGNEVEVAPIRLHIQCRWRVVDETRILFGRDDILRPLNPDIPAEDFDWDKDESVLDVTQRST
jgi:hypothetical protein